MQNKKIKGNLMRFALTPVAACTLYASAGVVSSVANAQEQAAVDLS